MLAGVTPAGVVVDTLTARCGGDTATATRIATDAGISQADIDNWAQPARPPSVTSIRVGVDTDTDTASLLASLPPPGPATENDPVRLLDTLEPGIEPTILEPAP